MTSRNAVTVCALMMLAGGALFAQTFPTVHLSKDDNAVLAVAIESRFPDHSQPVAVVDKLPHAPFDAVPLIRERNKDTREFAGLDLGRPIQIVSVGHWTDAPYGGMLFTLPAYEGDRAFVDYLVRFRTASGGMETGRVRATLTRGPNGWSVASEKYERVVPPPPPPPPQRVIPQPPQPSDAPLRVGGDVKAPVLIDRVEPKRTPEAIANRISGIVIVEALINEHGDVSDVHILKPLPFGLDQAAVDAVKQWHFKPGTLNGKPVAVIFNLTVNFRNED